MILMQGLWLIARLVTLLEAGSFVPRGGSHTARGFASTCSCLIRLQDALGFLGGAATWSILLLTDQLTLAVPL